MTRAVLTAALSVAVLFAAPEVRAAEIYKSEDTTLNLLTRLQLLGFGQSLKDPFRNDERVYLFVKQARFGVSGSHQDFKFTFLAGLAGEEEVKAPSPGVSLGLLDLFVDVPLKFLGSSTWLRVGQFEVPFSRERLTDSGVLRFGDRSINNVAFRIGRDTGLALHSRVGKWMGAAGVFTGGGRDVPERYLPQMLGGPMLIVRAGWNDGVDEDMFLNGQGGEESRRLRTAVIANVMYARDSLVGHSSVFNVRLGERSLLMNSNWNPYLAQAPFVRGEIWQAGADAALRKGIGNGELSAELEANFGTYSNSYGRVRTSGGRVQVGYAWSNFDLVARYAVVFPDKLFRSGAARITGTAPMQEVTPAFTWFVNRKWARIVVDAPILLRAPVVTETGVGSYVLSEQPDQTSLLKPNAAGRVTGVVARQTVVEGRMMFQAQF